MSDSPLRTKQGDSLTVGRCPGCGGDAGDNWFDRSLCAEPCGSMHTRCRECGHSLDGCSWETEDGLAVLGCCPHGVNLDRAFCPDGCRV